MLEGLLRSFNDMYGLPYVALRYFNVYGPRMDIHGKYTEVLIRWMERIAAGQPPLILGDGKTTMDFVYIDDVARANMLALAVRRRRRGVQRRQRRRDQPQRSGRRAAARHGLEPQARVRPRAQGQPGAAPAGRHQQGRRACWASAPTVDLDEGLRAWSTWWRANKDRMARLHDPDHQARDGRARGRRRAPRHPVRLDHAGPGGRGLRAGVRGLRRRASTPARSRTAPPRCTWRCSRSASGRRRGHHGQPLVHRHGQRHPLLRRRRRCSSTSSRPRSTSIPRLHRGGDHAAHHAPSCACTRWACPAISRPSCTIARAHGLPVIEDAACAIGSEIRWDGQWERIGRPHGDIACFSFHPRKVMSTGDGGMITTANAEWDAKFRLLRQHGMSVPDTVRHGSAQVIFESYPDRRLQLPHDRHPGRGRPRAAEAPAGDRRGPPRARRALPRSCWRTSPASALPHRAGVGAQQLAELLRAPAAGSRPARRHAAHARRRRLHAPRHHVQPSRAAVRQACLAASLPHSEAAQDHCVVLPLYIQMTDDEQAKVVKELLSACGRARGG